MDTKVSKILKTMVLRCPSEKRERKEKKLRKMDKCPRYVKQWVLRCPPKKEMNKIALVLLQKYFHVKGEICFQGA